MVILCWRVLGWTIHVFLYPLWIVGSCLSRLVFLLTLSIWVTITCGWLQRFILWWAEHEIRRLLNDTPVTIGSLEIHWWHGQVNVSNVILHTPRREEWQWQSPLIARIGKITIEISITLWIYSVIQYGGPQRALLEIYSVRAEDIQVFVERQENIFNFYLLDPMLDLPEPPTRLHTVGMVWNNDTKASASLTTTASANTSGTKLAALALNDRTDTEVNGTTGLATLSSMGGVKEVDDRQEDDINRNNYTSAMGSTTTTSLQHPSTESSPNIIGDDREGEHDDNNNNNTNNNSQQEAHQLVSDMVLAVQNIVGDVAAAAPMQRGGKITTALHRHRQDITSKLKQFTQQQQHHQDPGHDENKKNINKNNSVMLIKKGVQVMQQVSQAVVQNSKRGVQLLPLTPPAQKKQQDRPPPLKGRIGRILIRNVRIFTRSTTTTPGMTATNVEPITHAAISKTTVNRLEGEQVNDGVYGTQDQSSPPVTTTTTTARRVSLLDQPHSSRSNEYSYFDGPIEIVDNEDHILATQPPTDQQRLASDRLMNGKSDGPSQSETTAKSVSMTDATITTTTCWNRPLFVERVILRAADLCPPKSLMEQHENILHQKMEYPAIYQPLDKVALVVLKRVLAEMTKNNTGRLFETAMGEVLAYLQTPVPNNDSMNNNNNTTIARSSSNKPSLTTTNSISTGKVDAVAINPN